jgi:hypothetical protein
MRKDIINEHDVTKKMIDTLRGQSFINEADEGNDVITPSENDPVFKDEAKKIADTVDQRIQITKLKIYPKDNDVQFEGRQVFGINFFMSTKAGKLSISITDENGRPKQMFLDKESLDIINKLEGYYKNWAIEWGKKLNTEYKQK